METGSWRAVYTRTFACGTLYLQTFLERTGKCRTNIVNSLTEIREPVFKVTQSSVRDKFSKIIGNFRKKEAREVKAFGVDVEYDEIAKVLITDIKNRMDEGALSLQNNSAKKKKKAQEEKSQADDMRKKATAILESVWNKKFGKNTEQRLEKR